MDIEYDITRDDLYAFQWRAAYRSGRGRRQRLKVYTANIFIYTSRAAAHIIPKRIFPTVEDAGRFYQLARTSRANVQGSPG